MTFEPKPFVILWSSTAFERPCINSAQKKGNHLTRFALLQYIVACCCQIVDKTSVAEHISTHQSTAALENGETAHKFHITAYFAIAWQSFGRTANKNHTLFKRAEIWHRPENRVANSAKRKCFPYHNQWVRIIYYIATQSKRWYLSRSVLAY